MATTIQLSHKLKEELSTFKGEGTYEDVIKKLLHEHKQALVAEDMKAFGKKYAEQERKELAEWENTNLPW